MELTQLLEDGILAALAAFGLVSLLLLPVSAALRPRRRDAADAVALLPCRGGDGAALERAVRSLERARREYGCFRRIVLLDRGMDDETRQLAALLCRDVDGAAICSITSLPEELE